jgi:hypothetical protein
MCHFTLNPQANSKYKCVLGITTKKLHLPEASNGGVAEGVQPGFQIDPVRRMHVVPAHNQ